jgi:hypothetical protein
MLALCARCQLRPVGLALKSSQSRTDCDDGSPADPPSSPTASHQSRSSRSFIARHHTLPGGEVSSGSLVWRLIAGQTSDSEATGCLEKTGLRPAVGSV